MVFVALFNHKQSACGVYQYGKRISEIICKSQLFSIDYYEVSNYDEYLNCLAKKTYTIIIYNYHAVTMPWINRTVLRSIHSVHISIAHESPDSMFQIRLDVNPSAGLGLPRPIFETIPGPSDHPFITYGQDTGIPIIGSFGFGFTNKGFDKIIYKVNQEFDEAIIKFIIPIPDYGVNTVEEVAMRCRSVFTKPGIQIRVSHQYFTDNEILQFLSSNTINCFFYDAMHGRSISSAIDYALSVRKPLCITNSHMFRHIYSPLIDGDIVSIRSCIETSVPYLAKFNEAWCNQALIERVEKILR
jgi:hypothetical protein